MTPTLQPGAKNFPVKSIILAAISAGLAFIFGYVLNINLTVGGSGLTFIVVIAAILYLAAVALRVILVGNRWLLLAAAGTETIFLLAALYRHFSLALIVAILAVLAFLAAASSYGKTSLENVFKIRFWRLALPVISRAATGLAVLVAVLYVGTLNFQDPVSVKKFIAGIVQPVVPLAQELANSLIPAPVQSITGVNKLISAAALTDLIYQSTFRQFINLPPLYKNLGLAGVGLLVFLTLKGFLFIINYATAFLGQLIFKILKTAGFFVIETENMPKETIVLK